MSVVYLYMSLAFARVRTHVSMCQCMCILFSHVVRTIAPNQYWYLCLVISSGVYIFNSPLPYRQSDGCEDSQESCPDRAH